MSDNNQNQRIGALWSRQAKSSNQKYLSGNVTVNIGGEEKVVKVVFINPENFLKQRLLRIPNQTLKTTIFCKKIKLL